MLESNQIFIRRPAVFLKLEGIFDLFQGNLQNLKKEICFFFRTFGEKKQLLNMKT